jgi:hypothetical protein
MSEGVKDARQATRRMLRLPAVGLLLVSLLASCRPERLADPLSVLPPRCRMWTAPGADGCLSVHEEGQEYELRYEQAGGTVSTVIGRQSTAELLTEVKLNGVTTWVRRVGYDAGGAWRESEIVEFEYPTGKVLREERHRRSPAGNTIQAKARRVRTDGAAAQASWEFPFPRKAAMDGTLGPRPLVQMQDCSPYEVEVLEAELQSAFHDGVACMGRYERGDLTALLLSRYQRGPVVLACVQAASFLAASDASSYLGIIGATKLLFDKEAYFGRPAGGRTPTMLHELLHLWTGPHAPYVGLDTRSTDQDRTEACVSLCYGRAERVSKCDCALCLGVPKDDARCNSFLECGGGAVR